VILKWVFGSDLDATFVCAAVANDRDEGLNMLFDVMVISDISIMFSVVVVRNEYNVLII